MFSEYKAIARTRKVNKIRRTGWEGGRKTPCAAEGSHAGETGQAAHCLQINTSPLSAEICGIREPPSELWVSRTLSYINVTQTTSHNM